MKARGWLGCVLRFWLVLRLLGRRAALGGGLPGVVRGAAAPGCVWLGCEGKSAWAAKCELAGLLPLQCFSVVVGAAPAVARAHATVQHGLQMPANCGRRAASRGCKPGDRSLRGIPGCVTARRGARAVVGLSGSLPAGAAFGCPASQQAASARLVRRRAPGQRVGGWTLRRHSCKKYLGGCQACVCPLWGDWLHTTAAVPPEPGRPLAPLCLQPACTAVHPSPLALGPPLYQALAQWASLNSERVRGGASSAAATLWPQPRAGLLHECLDDGSMGSICRASAWRRRECACAASRPWRGTRCPAPSAGVAGPSGHLSRWPRLIARRRPAAGGRTAAPCDARPACGWRFFEGQQAVARPARGAAPSSCTGRLRWNRQAADLR